MVLFGATNIKLSKSNTNLFAISSAWRSQFISKQKCKIIRSEGVVSEVTRYCKTVLLLAILLNTPFSLMLPPLNLDVTSAKSH